MSKQKITFSELEEETFTQEEQEEYCINEHGESLENYDTFRHCALCGEPTPTSDMKLELNMGCLCRYCIMDLYSRGEKPIVVDLP